MRPIVQNEWLQLPALKFTASSTIIIKSFSWYVGLLHFLQCGNEEGLWFSV